MSNIIADPLSRIKKLSNALEANDFESIAALVHMFRQEKPLLAELPSVFEGALESILERLESTAMFDVEACSFSQTDLFAALNVWCEKADSYLRKQMGV